MASYQTCFDKNQLKDIKEGRSTMVGSFNVGTTKTSQKGMFGPICVSYNPDGVANLLFMPAVEAMGYKVLYDGD